MSYVNPNGTTFQIALMMHWPSQKKVLKQIKHSLNVDKTNLNL